MGPRKKPSGLSSCGRYTLVFLPSHPEKLYFTLSGGIMNKPILLVFAIGLIFCNLCAKGPEVKKGAKTMDTIKIESAAFKHMQPIPSQYSCDGADISPPLSWSNVPAGAKS